MSPTDTLAANIHGDCDPRFAAVRDALADNFAQRDEIGSAVCVYHQGRKVVDLWGGHMDAARHIPWREDTLCLIYSVSKSLCALCVHILADRGQVDLEAPVATYWPEFAQAGKDAIRVRHILSHNCGVFTADAAGPDDVFHWNAMIRALEAQAPLWPPETKGAYNTVNIGYLAGEVVRRVSGQRITDFLQDNVCRPLGIELYLGVPESELGRCADIVANPAGNPLAEVLNEPDSIFARACRPMAIDKDPNSRRFRTAGIPSYGGFGEARGLARLYAALGNGGELNGVRLLSHAAVERANTLQWSSEADSMTCRPMAFSMGFWKNGPNVSPMGDNPNAFGHLGIGGPRAFTDPDRKLAVGYVTNFQTEGAGTGDRVEAVVDAIMRCVG